MKGETMKENQLLNIPNDLSTWLAHFQAELRDDIDNGARLDCTRKPGFYTVQTRQYIAHPDGEWMLFTVDDDTALTPSEYLNHLAEMNAVRQMAEILFYACQNENGLFLDICPGHGESSWCCDCDCPDFASPQVTLHLADIQMTVFKDLYDHVIIEDEEAFTQYVTRKDEDYVAQLVQCKWVDDDNAVFLTRKSGERYAERHYGGKENRVYARWVWHNPDLYNIIAALAALDIEKSTLVFDHDRLRKLDY